MSAGDYLDSLNFPADARRLLFDVFAHSFFNPEEEMSAGELLMMFHFYFTGNPEGLVFDVVDAPFSQSLWEPFGRYLERGGWMCGRARRWTRSAGGRRRLAGLRRRRRGGRRRRGAGAERPGAPGNRRASPDLDDPDGGRRSRKRQLTNPFAVWRLWLDRPTAAGRAPFVGTTGMGPLDNISLYELFEDESRDWAERNGGSVVELHAYAVDEGAAEEELKRDLLGALHQLYPETRDARILEERCLVRQDCPAFAAGATRRGPAWPRRSRESPSPATSSSCPSPAR